MKKRIQPTFPHDFSHGPITPSRITAGILLALGATTAQAQEVLWLPTVTVEEQRIDERVKRLEQEQARDMRDIFSGEVNADVAGGVRNGQRLYLRGVEGSNVNITVDGARQGQNLYNHRGGLGNVDPDILKRIDIQPGPPAADDGHGALGGSIRFETVDAQDRLRPDQPLGARVRAGYASADKGTRASASLYGLAGQGVGLLGHVSWHDHDDLRTGEGDRTPYSGGRDESYLFKLSALGMPDHQLRLGTERHEASGLQFQQRGDYPWQMQPDDLSTRPPRHQTLLREQHTLDYRFNPSAPLVDLKLNLYQSTNRWQGKTPSDLVERFTSDGQGYDLRNTFHYGGDAVQGGLVVGIDQLRDRGTNHRQGRGDRRNRYENQGIYLQNRVQFADTRLSFGVRHDDFEASFRNNTTRTGNTATSYNLSGETGLGGGFTVFGGYGESARGAGTIPIHFAGNVVEGALINGSADGRLAPEVSRQGEAGVRWEGLGAGGASIRMEALAFQNRIQDAILFDQPGSGGLGRRPVTELYNSDQTATFKGYEIRAAYAAGRFTGGIGFMRLDTDGLPSQPQFLARFGAPQGDRLILDLGYLPQDGLELTYRLTAVGRLTDVPADQTVFIEKSGYTTHDLAAVWTPAGLSNLSFDLAVRNLFDKSYSRHTTLSQNELSTLEPGRDIRLGARYVF
ncbi:TonB-dependent receptor [Ectothiorhodospira sp. PHS-1]|uniref:TonB-dependent receptor plug domain-containing protein n=1 Tax=Ectothiorhodospira sp. PHS-1 TaxID=519989 RepID=UPI00024A8B2A|nr:TonB-dependent receptor plug domain-containing protein [Ectothiorhodospira sp. PHS-1]EHQ52557.1 TonB-dependent receptor [Ectothiorhodospira sp. PHS-1]